MKVHARARLIVLCCLAWSLFIFLTSCTVVRPQEFFDWIRVHLLVHDDVFLKFQAFWGVSWFAVVKGWHALEFAILFLLCLAAIERIHPADHRMRTIGWSIAICTLFAISDEWHQTFVPDRGGAVTDVLIDMLGILIAAWITIRRRCPQRLVANEFAMRSGVNR